ncbi:unnamed protein product, partial [marine sediment metagenome]
INWTTKAYYDQDTDEIILGATPDAGMALYFSITYYEGTPEMTFSGYLGDSIKPNPEDGTIELSFRDKGKKLQDTMIDGITNVIDISNWDLKSTSDDDIVNIIEVDSATGIFTTATAHNFTTGDNIRFNQVDSLPLQSNGDRLNGTYAVTVLSSITFSLDTAILEFTTNINITALYVRPTDKIVIGRIGPVQATLDFANDKLTFENETGITTEYFANAIYSFETKSLIFLENSVKKQFNVGSNFDYTNANIVGDTVTI